MHIGRHKMLNFSADFLLAVNYSKMAVRSPTGIEPIMKVKLTALIGRKILKSFMFPC